MNANTSPRFTLLKVIFLSLVAAALLLSACGAERQPSRLPDPNDVKALLVQLVDVEKRAPGIVVGMIAADPQERWVVGYGRLSATDQRVPDGDTVFELASIGKVFTGMLLAQAVVNGEVKLDDPISMYLPEGVTAPEYEGRSITLLDLATHYSGLPWGDIKPMDASYTLDQMYGFLSEYRLTRAPGSQIEYSTFGFGLLGNLLVRRAGVADYEALLVDRITGPLGMDSTHIGLTPEMASRLAPPHANYSDPAPRLDAPTIAGAGGGLMTTANDMLKFLAANMGLTGPELQPAIRLANTPQRPDGRGGYYGLGWGVSKSGKGGHGHIGGNPGYSTYLLFDTERRIGLVVLSNSASNIDDVIGLQLLRGLPKPFPVDPQVLAEYAGRYQSPDGHFVTIRVDGGRIFLQIPNQGEFELVARSNDQFYPQEFDAELTFYRNESGEVDRGVLLQSGETTEAKKVP